MVITRSIFLLNSNAISSGVLLENLHLTHLVFFLTACEFDTLLHYSCVFAYVRARNAGIIALLEPASDVVFAAIILSQPITSSVLVGGGLVLLWCAGG